MNTKLLGNYQTIADTYPSIHPLYHLTNPSRWVAGLDPHVGLVISSAARALASLCGDYGQWRRQDDKDDNTGKVRHSMQQSTPVMEISNGREKR